MTQMSRLFYTVSVALVLLSGCVSPHVTERVVVKNENALKVAVYVGAGAAANGVAHWQMLTTLSPDVVPTFVDERTIAAGALSGQDIFVMPGGSSYLEFDTLKKTGADEKVKAFVRNGGGYVGTCAGNCCVLNEGRRLCMSPYRRLPSSGQHGTALLAMSFNQDAESLCGIKAGSRHVRYSGGPVMCEGKPVEGAAFKTIATYDCDLVDNYGTNATVRSMRGCPAAICGTYGKGRVFAIATHPEYRADTLDILAGGFRYVSGRGVSFVRPQRKKGDLCVAVYAPGLQGIEDARLIARLVTTEGLDVSFMNQKEEIGVGYLDHADVLVMPAGSEAVYKKKFNAKTGAFFEKFVQGGGKVFACGAGAKYAPKGAVVCESGAEIVEKICQ